MVDSMVNDNSKLLMKTNSIEQDQQQYHRLQLLAQAIEKIEGDCSQKTHLPSASSPCSNKQRLNPIDSFPMTSPQPQELLMQLLNQQNVAAVMAAAAAAASQLQLNRQKSEPISPPSTSSASSSIESPLDFSSRRSTDETNDCPSSSPSPPNPQLLSAMLQNLQPANSLSTTNFPFLLTNKNGKPTRPFKAYPRDPLMLPLGFCSNSTSEQNNLLVDAASRATSTRKRLAQTQERLKKRLEQQQQQQQQMNNTHFISSSGAQILQPPKKRHRALENPVVPIESNSNKELNNDSNNTIKDDAYWERRRKNNEAAKRSRDARRVKEDEIAIRAALLEQENIKLRLELTQLKQETAKLRCMIHATS